MIHAAECTPVYACGQQVYAVYSAINGSSDMPKIVSEQFNVGESRWSLWLDGKTREFDVNVELDGEYESFVRRARAAARRRGKRVTARKCGSKVRITARNK